jgi:hypothetical protein
MLNSNRGQALIESVLILPLSILFLIYVSQVFIYFSVELSIDDAMEDFLFCKVQNKIICEENFKNHLAHLPVVDSHFKSQNSKFVYSLNLETTALRIFNIQKTRTLNYSLQIL